MTKPIYILLIIIVLVNNYFGQNARPLPVEVDAAVDLNVRPVGAIDYLNGEIDLSWFAPVAQAGEASKWTKMEYGVQLPESIAKRMKIYFAKSDEGLGLNPYNPDQVDCYAEFTAPSGKFTRTNGFYYQPKIRDFINKNWKSDTTSFPFRVRFAPDEVGEWTVSIGVKVTEQNQLTFHKEVATKFNCVSSRHKGRLTYKKGDRHYRYSETDSSYFGVGGTIGHSDYYNLSPEASMQHIKWLDQLGQSEGNYFRLELSGRNGLPDWDDAENYQTRQEEMWEVDRYVDKAEQYKMYFTMFRHHIEILDENVWDVVKWENNPYRKMFNLTSRTSYFQDEDVIKQQQKCLRYIFARWGYTPYFAFYGYTELDGWYDHLMNDDGHSWEETESIFAKWMQSNIEFIDAETHYVGDMYACGYASARSPDLLKKSKVFPLCDMIPLHSYQSVKWGNFKEIYNYITSMEKAYPNIPIQLEEVGQEITTYCCTDVEFHNCLWSNSMMNISGTPNHWWWDRGIHYQGYYKQYEHVASFFKDEQLNNMNYSKQRWTDRPGPALYQSRAKLENLAMVSEDKTRVLGWVHNATYYWRNLEQSNACIRDLVDNSRLDSNKCIVESGMKMADGDETSRMKELQNDYFTNRGGAIDIVSEKPMEDNPAFVISGLKGNGNKTYNPWAKNHWYIISYFNTRGEVSDSPVFQQVAKTSSVGKLKLNVPNLDANNPDYSYKVEYIGRFSNRTSMRTILLTENYNNK